MKKQISAHDRLKAAELLLKRYPTKPAREEQELRNEKLRAEVADLNTHTDEEAVVFEFSRKSETTEEN